MVYLVLAFLFPFSIHHIMLYVCTHLSSQYTNDRKSSARTAASVFSDAHARRSFARRLAQRAGCGGGAASVRTYENKCVYVCAYVWYWCVINVCAFALCGGGTASVRTHEYVFLCCMGIVVW